MRQWTGSRNPLLLVGLGTGAGYFACNFPPLFTSSPGTQGVVAGLLCLVGVGVSFSVSASTAEEAETERRPTYSFFRVLGCFAALVWLDSAAFFIIQNTPALKAGTWEGSLHLWANGGLHFAAALASVWLLRRKGLSLVLSAAFVALGVACLLLLDPSHAAFASVIYPIGVSLYSVALVAYPSLLAPAASAAERGRMAGWIYAIAGWLGSAMGIGMGQNLGHVPPVFVLGAGCVVLLPWVVKTVRGRQREMVATAVVLLAAFCVEHFVVAVQIPSQLNEVERGRQVYISEGCINCHSQYVRPNTADVLMWGPSESIEDLRREHPPLIGNRRQGPDLAEVGGRRSPLWLRAHFFDPHEVSGGSIMPSYAYLFLDRRGNDLVAYIESLQGSGTVEHVAAERDWHLSASSMAAANAGEGERLYERHCATCHNVNGSTRLIWQANFKRLPPDLRVGPFYYLPPYGPAALRIDRLAQITKFGVAGTDMPGHEYLPDSEIASISLWLTQSNAQLSQNR